MSISGASSFLLTRPSLFWSDQALIVIKATHTTHEDKKQKGQPATTYKGCINDLKSYCGIRVIYKDGTKVICDIFYKYVNIHHPFAGENWNYNKHAGAYKTKKPSQERHPKRANEGK